MNTYTKITKPKDLKTISEEWDLIAEAREATLCQRKDISFSKVLSRQFDESRFHDNILEVGCGTGQLSEEISTRFPLLKIDAIDPSARSIHIAKNNRKNTNIKFINSSIENFSSNNKNKYNYIFSNMVLMDAPDIYSFCESLFTLSKSKRTRHTLTNPKYWPLYWKYDKHPKFDPSQELFIETMFRTSAETYTQHTTHIHRPISMYREAFKLAGFKKIQFTDLRGPETKTQFKYPRFLIIDTF